jgi:hypothetical protein
LPFAVNREELAMTVRYTAAWFDDDTPYLQSRDKPITITTISIYQPEKLAFDTGLLDRNGSKIWRIEEHDPIGFHPVKRQNPF